MKVDKSKGLYLEKNGYEFYHGWHGGFAVCKKLDDYMIDFICNVNCIVDPLGCDGAINKWLETTKKGDKCEG